MKPLAYTLTVLALIAGITLAAAPHPSSAQTSESSSASLIDSIGSLLDEIKQRISTVYPSISTYIQGDSQVAALSGSGSGLVAHYTFDEGSGTTAGDSSGSDNDGTLQGSPTWVDGKIGSSALNFDGSDDEINVSNSAELSQMTISLWMFVDAQNAADTLISKASMEGDDGLWYLETITGGRIRFIKDVSTTDLAARFAPNYAINQWNHVALVWNGGLLKSDVTMYVNGVAYSADKTGSDGEGSILSDIGLDYYMGSRAGLRYFDGRLDDVRVYSRALSASEVQSLYQGSTDENPETTDGDTDDADSTDTATQEPEVDGETITAVSCSQNHVQDAISQAEDGYIVEVPTGTCTWTSPDGNAPSVAVDKAITLRGAGTDETVVIDETGSRSYQHSIQVSSNNARVTGFTIRRTNTSSDAGAAVSASGVGWRIDHNKFVVAVSGRGVIARGKGLIDHNEFIDTRQGVSVFGTGDASWDAPPSLGTGNAVFVEDNIFRYSSKQDGALDAYNGARYVFRYNDVVGTTIGHHGLDSGGYRSPLSWEVYKNDFTNPDGTNLPRMFGSRGGTGVVFGNTLTDSSDYPWIRGITLANYRSCPSSNVGEWGYCDGDNPIDGNLESNGYPCKDQNGRTTDLNGDGIQDAYPIYEWNNHVLGEEVDWSINGSCEQEAEHIQEGRDFYNDSCRPGYTPYEYPHPLVQEQDGVSAETVSLNCPDDGSPVNGTCGTTLNSCTSGTLSDTADSDTHYLWECLGANGGSDASCSLEKTSDPEPDPNQGMPRGSEATLRGDLNSDGVVNSLDWSIMRPVWGTADSTADLNNDGVVNSIDFSVLNQNWTQ